MKKENSPEPPRVPESNERRFHKTRDKHSGCVIKYVTIDNEVCYRIMGTSQIRHSKLANFLRAWEPSN